MSKPVRITLIAAGSIVLLLCIAVITGLIIAQSDWLREKIRVAVIEQAEKATGGRVEIQKFQLDWTGLTADVYGVVIHGTEPAGQAPFLAVDHATIGFRIISLLTRDIRLDRINAIHPQAHIIIDANGGTNLPRPKVPGKGSTPDTILNLKINRFEVHNGGALVESPGSPPRTYPWTVTGQNLAALATYDRIHDKYTGDVSLTPVHLTLEDYGPLDVNVHVTGAMERNRLTFPNATIRSAASEIDLTDVNVGSFAAPVATANYDIKASAIEAVKVLHWKLPVTGPLNVVGKARYVSPTDFDTTGVFRGTGMSYSTIRNIRLTGDMALNQDMLRLTGVHANFMGGDVSGTAETKGFDTFRINGKIAHLDVRDLAALGTTKPIPYDGLLSGTVDASGRFREISGKGLESANAQLTIDPPAKGPAVHGEVTAHYTGSVDRLELGHSWVELPATRVDVNGTLGSTLNVKLVTRDLKDFAPVLEGRPLPFELRNGSLAFDGTVTGALARPSLAGHAEVSNAVYNGTLVDSAKGDVNASMSQAKVTNVTLVSEGITATGGGSIGLVDWATSNASVISADAAASNVDISHALALAGNKDAPVTGTLAVTGHVSGTLGQPVANADVTLTKGLIYQQPYDSVTAQVRYVNANSQTVGGLFVSGTKRVNFNVDYLRNGQDFPAGTLQISATSNAMALNQIALVRQRQPDIEGMAQFKGTATLVVSRDAKKDLHLDLTKIDGDGSATGIMLAGRDLGDSHFTAKTQGTTVTAVFDSNAAKAVIKGEAKVELRGEDQTTGSITFSNAGLNALAAAIVTQADAKSITFDGSAEGQLDFNGPLFDPAKMSATATVRQLEVHPLPGTPLTKSIPGFSLKSVGPIKISFDKSVLRVESAHFQAPETDITVSGSADTQNSSPLNLRAQGTVNLALLRNFVPDLAASGSVALNANVRGNWSNPDLNGTANIRGGEFHYADFTNGLSNANGDIVFSGTRATISSFTADTGGGKFTGSGFATLNAGAVSFQFSAKTKDVRLRYPQGVSSISDSEIQLVRNLQRSNISGTVTVRRLSFNPQQDTAATLADVSRSAPTPPAGDNSLAGMNLDILIQTAPDVALQSKVADSIQADATLRLRGTVGSPAMLGRINISQGSVIFFGNKYNISRGAVSFFNPTKIDPILDVDLQTKARGVDVTLTVTGPPSHLGLVYRSDPPLEFSDIVALLATGRTPDDPSLALRGNAPTQSFEQLGASALIGQTLATPLAGRLQRFFGVSKIKIDPQLAGVGGTPGARVTVEQQITPDILFTYITDVANTSQQLIRAEWAFNPKWSAILAREENGYVGVDFEYKRRFK